MTGPAGGSPRARKALGQHFLHDRDVLERIVAALPQGGLPVVEIGAGTGELTQVLLDRGHDVIAVEVEPRLLRHLRARFGDNPRLRLAQGDARDLDYAKLVDSREYVAAGNLPYFAANPIVRGLLESPHQPRAAVVMVQKEVAQEMAPPPGKLSLLGISVQVYATAEYLFDVPPEAFDPPPTVMSGVIRLSIREEPLVVRERMEQFFDVVRKVFRNPRKQIHNALSRGLWLTPEAAQALLVAAAIDPARRPETLSVTEWNSVVAQWKQAHQGG